MEVADGQSGLTRAQRKYQKRKAKQQEKKLFKKNDDVGADESLLNADGAASSDLQIEYVAVDPMSGLDVSDPQYAEFAEIFRRFSVIASGKSPEEEEKKRLEAELEAASAAALESVETVSAPVENVPKKLSHRQRRLASRVDVADLKAAAKRADLVEIHDTTAADPFLLVQLKAYRNTVPVPRHWSQKRKYLQGKRGVEKIPYLLPDFIRNTGIAELRQAALDRVEAQKLKAKQRERLRPKMGQLDVDYQVLHDAFFRYQSRPMLSGHGELYYEGKEFEPQTRDFVSGVLSENLRKALGMPENAPPPWLPQMQQYGPPPSYPGLRVPGVNAPIPQGAKYGFHAGGWGRAPVDINGRPIWGWADAQMADIVDNEGVNDFEPNYKWGAMLYAEDYAEEEEETETAGEEEDETRKTAMQVDRQHPQSIADRTLEGEEEEINLRKFGAAATGAKTAPEVPQQLFQVLQQQGASVGSAVMGSSHTYVLPPKSSSSSAATKRTIGFLGTGGLKAGELEITLDPSDFELTEDQLRQKYEKLYREHEKQQLQPQASQQITEADRDELMRKSMPTTTGASKHQGKPKDKKSKDYVKF